MHRLLARQLRKATSASGEVDLQLLLELVSASYDDTDRDQNLARQAAQLMEEELRAAASRAAELAELQLRIILNSVGEAVRLCLISASTRFCNVEKHLRNFHSR